MRVVTKYCEFASDAWPCCRISSFRILYYVWYEVFLRSVRYIVHVYANCLVSVRDHSQIGEKYEHLQATQSLRTYMLKYNNFVTAKIRDCLGTTVPHFPTATTRN
jgi:hypothetical protein